LHFEIIGNIYLDMKNKSFVSSKQSFSRLGKVQTLRDLPSALGLSKTFLFGGIFDKKFSGKFDLSKMVF